ncbi:hypothetical protein BWI17_19285 [Betaproteobacteria bacterium GR16-43]|nr:hypothetical protein BWI17_19285 [Betaproteobacteria bacterium GR16-43]
MTEDRSPLKGRPLRYPGQSCEERRRTLFDEKLETPLFVAGAAIVLTLVEFMNMYWLRPPSPWVYLFIACVTIAFAAFRVHKYLPEIRNLKLAADGEKVVGQYLDRLRSEGYEILHDIPADGFNVDHLVIGPAGIFTIETKTWRKPRRGDARVHFDGKNLLVGGHVPQRDPVAQARAQASWVARELEESTGRSYRVRPVVLFPGWWVEAAAGAQKDMWVLEPKALPGFLANEPRRLELEQIRMASYHMSRYVRTFLPTLAST